MLLQTEKIIRPLKLPKEILLGASCIKWTGTYEVIIENYKGIIEFGNERIIVRGKGKNICIIGKNLKIESYNDEFMQVTGHIVQIKYIEPGKYE